MRSKVLFVAFLLVGGFASAQVKSEKQVVKNEVKKEVSIEEVNGEKTLTIRTSSNGTETLEVYKGQEAEEKIAAMNAESEAKVEERVYVEEINGVKTVKIERTENGVTSVEQYQGEEADRKLQEMESRELRKNQRMELKKEMKVNRIEKPTN
ncbi:MAG: hypothetical protein EP305_05865 [Bacteroidetes bacterium]|nr:MAG: hypothetical protein EP305_05865 [Bacteroidota bacterium]